MKFTHCVLVLSTILSGCAMFAFTEPRLTEPAWTSRAPVIGSDENRHKTDPSDPIAPTNADVADDHPGLTMILGGAFQIGIGSLLFYGVSSGALPEHGPTTALAGTVIVLSGAGSLIYGLAYTIFAMFGMDVINGPVDVRSQKPETNSEHKSTGGNSMTIAPNLNRKGGGLTIGLSF